MDFLITQEPHIEKFEYAGKQYQIEVKDLSWPLKNKIISKATKIDKQGNATFDMDIFNREVLLTILGVCKYTENGIEKQFTIDAIMMLGLKADFGAILEKFIPSPAVSISKEDEKN